MLLIKKHHAVSIYFLIIYFIAAAIYPEHASAQDNMEGNIHFFIKAYGLADPDGNPLVKRSYEIFDRVCSVADKRGHRLPDLKIINSLNDPYTASLPGGHIVLSVKAVDICYKDAIQEKGDARMAFILGHELAHLANDDFWHLETFKALSGDQNIWSDKLRQILLEGSDVFSKEDGYHLAVSKKKEMAADDLGFLYAALAGYSMNLIGTETTGDNNFFTYWMQQTHTKVDISHPVPEERARLLQIRLSNLKEKIDFYKFGVRFASFGRYEDAIYFFEAFQKIFPSREVYNNLGYCYLQMAIKKMPPSVAYTFWLPSALDITSRAERLIYRQKENLEEIPKEALNLLGISVNYFKLACHADATYLPSRINLAVSYYYLSAFFKARAVIEEAVKISPDNLEVQGLRALIICRESPDVDMWPHAIRIFDNLSKRIDVPPFVLYNFAMLLEKRKRNGEAQAVWKRLVDHMEEIPKIFRGNVCKENNLTKGMCASSPPKSIPVPLEMTIQAGTDLLKEKKLKNMLISWKQISYDWQNKMIRGHIYQNLEGTSILSINDFVEMVVLNGKDLGTLAEWMKRNGQPGFKTNLFGGMLLSYDKKWSVWVQDGNVKEVWISE